MAEELIRDFIELELRSASSAKTFLEKIERAAENPEICFQDYTFNVFNCAVYIEPEFDNRDLTAQWVTLSAFLNTLRDFKASVDRSLVFPRKPYI